MRVLGLVMGLIAAWLPPAQAAEYHAGGKKPDRVDYCTDVGEIRVSAGWWIDSIQLVCYDSGRAQVLPRRGGPGGTLQKFRLADGDQISVIEGRAGGPHGDYVYTLRFRTSSGKASPVFGGGGDAKGDRPFRLQVRNGEVFGGISTYAGDFIENVGLVTEPAVAARRLVAPTDNVFRDDPPATLPSARCCKKILGICSSLGSDCVCC